MRKTTLCLPEDLVVRLRQLAKRVGRPSAAIVREAVQRYVSVEEAPAPESVGAGYDPKLSGRKSEAWLRARWARRR